MNNKPTERDLVAAVEDLRNLPPDAPIEMTRQQFEAVKRTVWWHRELYSPVGLTHLFPGLGGKK